MKVQKRIILLVALCIGSASFLQGRTSNTKPACNHVVCEKEVKEHFDHVKKQVDMRWNAFTVKDKILKDDFATFKTGKSDEEIEKEFLTVLEKRKAMWKHRDYERAKHLIKNDFVRHTSCVAFAYNNTVANFNASTVFLGEKPYIACEGPRKKDLEGFFNLLSTVQATHIVRLTGAREGDKEKCHPYWKKHSSITDTVTYLNVPKKNGIHKVKAFDIADWKDNQGVEPEKLLAVVLQVRQELKDPTSLLAIHCSAGVGRTGTFLAALAIVDAIDKGAPFSIQEIVYRLSLQRIYSVSNKSQYLTLYRMAELYKQK